MCITEYDEKRTLAEKLEEGRIEGREEGSAEGRTEGMLETLIELVNKGLISKADAADTAHMSIAKFESKAAAYAGA